MRSHQYFSVSANKLKQIRSNMPCTYKRAQELISEDIHESKKQYKFTFSIELIPICKDDLVALPLSLARQLGNISPLTLCHRVSTTVNLIDPQTLQTAEVPSSTYWRAPFKGLADVTELKEYIVLDIEPVGQSNGRFFLAEATVARASDLGSNDITYFTRTHLGGVLHVGDSAMGYDLTGTVFNDDNFAAIEANKKHSATIPDVILVKKFYARKKKPKGRNWRLRRMAREYDEESVAQGNSGGRRQDQENRLEQDFEMFLRDVEEDQELRQTLDLYKARNRAPAQGDMDMDEDSESDDEAPKINVDELLDEFDELNMDDE